MVTPASRRVVRRWYAEQQFPNGIDSVLRGPRRPDRSRRTTATESHLAVAGVYRGHNDSKTRARARCGRTSTAPAREMETWRQSEQDLCVKDDHPERYGLLTSFRSVSRLWPSRWHSYWTTFGAEGYKDAAFWPTWWHEPAIAMACERARRVSRRHDRSFFSFCFDRLAPAARRRLHSGATSWGDFDPNLTDRADAGRRAGAFHGLKRASFERSWARQSSAAWAGQPGRITRTSCARMATCQAGAGRERGTSC